MGNKKIIVKIPKDEEEEQDVQQDNKKLEEQEKETNNKKRNLKKLADDIWAEMNSPNKKAKTSEASKIDNSPSTPTKPTIPFTASPVSPGSRFSFSKSDNLLKEAQKAKEIAIKSDSEIKLGINVNVEKKIYDFAGEKVE